MRMKIGIFGSRSLHDNRVKTLILEEMDRYNADTIVTTQEPKGVCTVAQNVAKFEHYILELHFLDFKYRAGAYEHRSDAVIAASDRILLIHDGISHGTRNELARCKKAKIPYNYVILTPDEKEREIDNKLDSFVSLASDNADSTDVDFDLAFEGWDDL